MRERLASLLATFVWVALGFLPALPALAGAPRVFPDAESVEPLPVGAKIPSALVRTLDGETVDLAQRLSERGALLVFYRGGW